MASATCMASSRVGASTRPWTSRTDGSTAASSGSPNAAVLPVPVCATPITSRPSSSEGIACSWIGEGEVNPSASTALRSASGRSRASKPFRAAGAASAGPVGVRSEERTSELQSRGHLVCRLLLAKTNNKVPGIRAACAASEFAAWNARAHNDANILTLGSRVLGIEVAWRIVQTFLETDFEGGRHAKRVDMLGDIEARYLADRGEAAADRK